MAEKKYLVKRLETASLMKGLANDFWADVKRARENGHKIGWLTGAVPFDLLRAMDIRWQHMESYGALVAARKAHGELKDVAHAAGYSRDVCSYARITHGRRILEERGKVTSMRPDVVYPTPDFVVAMPTCPTMGFVADSFARNYHVPLFVFEIPTWHHESEIERLTVYFRHQMDDFINFLQQITGRPLDYERLRQGMILLKKAAELRCRCLELCKIIPSPMTVFDMFISVGPINYLRGTPQSVAFYEKLLAEVENRVAHKIGAVSDEQYRLYWDNLPIWFKVGDLSEKLASLKANAVISQYTYIFWSRPERINPDDPIGTLVEEYVGVFGGRSLDWRINLISKMVKEYSLDGLLIHSSHTCRPFDIGQYDIINAVQQRTGVPGLMIDGDPTDPDFYSDAQINTRLEAFIETLAARREQSRG